MLFKKKMIDDFSKSYRILKMKDKWNIFLKFCFIFFFLYCENKIIIKIDEVFYLIILFELTIDDLQNSCKKIST